jgi:dienelactone hydrolase
LQIRKIDNPVRVKRRILLISLALTAAVVTLYCVRLGWPQRDYFIERAGSPTQIELAATDRPDGITETVSLVSSSGLRVDLRTLRPPAADGERLPVLILLGGHRTGRNAVDLVGEPDGIAFAAIDYPYEASHHLDGFWESLAAVPAIQQAFRDTPPALSLALTWLLQQSWVDPQRVELVGVSLGVPFAAAAGGVDKRFSRVWLLHGGADNQSWVEHAGRRSISNDTLRRVAAAAALFLVYGRSLDTRDWLPEIAPRPLIVVAARGDDFVPPAAQAPFIEAAKNGNVELIWTDGRHIQPNRIDELRQLLDIVRSRVTAAASTPTHPAALDSGGR